MTNFTTASAIIETFIQSELNKFDSSPEYIQDLNECETLEDLISAVKDWKSNTVTTEYSSASEYILLSLDK